MNKGMMWVMVIVALVVGVGIGFYAERTRATQKLEDTKMMMQQQIDDAKKAAMMAPTGMMEPTGTMMQGITMMSKTGYVTDSKGMALYVFDTDTKGTSSCYGQCATIWPAFKASGPVPSPMPEHLGTIQRTDGTTQYTWDGKPLYYYQKDKDSADTYGNGVGGVWHLAK